MTDGFHNIPAFSSLNVWTETEELIGFGGQIHQNFFFLQLEEMLPSILLVIF